jgi:hypothetical protein
MSLLADTVGFSEPGGDFVIDLSHALEPKRVEMISRRKSFNAPEARIFEAAGEDDVAVHPVSPNDESREAHAHVKGDTRLFGEDGDRAIRPGDREEFVEDGADGGRFSSEMRRQGVTAARMRLITIGELPPAARAAPQFQKAPRSWWIGRSGARCLILPRKLSGPFFRSHYRAISPQR